MMRFLTEKSTKEKRSKEEELNFVKYSIMVTKVGKILTRNLDIELGFTFVEPYFSRFLQLCYWCFINSKLNNNSNFGNRVKSICQELNENIDDLRDLLTKEIENLENDNTLTEGSFKRIGSQIRNLHAILTINLSDLIIARLVQTEKASVRSELKAEKKKYLVEFVDSKNNSRNTSRSLVVNNIPTEIITPTNLLDGITLMKDSGIYYLEFFDRFSNKVFDK